MILGPSSSLSSAGDGFPILRKWPGTSAFLLCLASRFLYLPLTLVVVKGLHSLRNGAYGELRQLSSHSDLAFDSPWDSRILLLGMLLSSDRLLDDLAFLSTLP